MVWFALSDDLVERVLLTGLSRSTALTLVELGAWSSRLLTDGALPRAMVRSASTSPDLEADLGALVAAGFLEPTGTGWRWPRWEDSQRTREQVEADRAANKVRQQRHRDKRASAVQRRETAHAAADHRWCFPESCPVARNAVTPPVTNGSTNGHPLPLPSSPPDNGGGEGGGEGDVELSSAEPGADAGASHRFAKPRRNGRTSAVDRSVEAMLAQGEFLAATYAPVNYDDELEVER